MGLISTNKQNYSPPIVVLPGTLEALIDQERMAEMVEGITTKTPLPMTTGYSGNFRAIQYATY